MHEPSAHFKQNAVVAMCAAARRCGCEKRTPAECAPSVIADAPDVSGAFFACVSQQPCEELCHPNPTRPGGGIQTRCMQPALEASSAVQALRTTQLMLQLNLQMQQRMHETTMGIIRNMAPSPTRVDVYDAQGNYLRSE